MPELPEVETVKRTLEQLVVGKKIEDVEINWPKMIKQPDDVHEFVNMIVGQTIIAMGRRGKFLKFILDDYVLVSHLRMEGRYSVNEKLEERNKHVHIIFTLSNGKELRYQDVRKFGTMHLFKKGEEDFSSPLSKLGVEPFDQEFTPDLLYNGLQKTVRNVKAALLDQKIVVGLGNIYVDEALYQAKIHPQKIANKLTRDEVEILHHYIVTTLQEAVAQGGTTVRSYVNGQGDMGMFQQYLYVYGRRDEPCRDCLTPIEKIKVAGRGTHFCPNCQN